jgi:hypothetical protein
MKRKAPMLALYRPGWGVWLLYALYFLLICGLVAISFIEPLPAWLRLGGLVCVALSVAAIVDLGRSRIELAEDEIRFFGLHRPRSFPYAEIVAVTIVAGNLLMRTTFVLNLSTRRSHSLPVWVGRRTGRELAGRIQARLRRRGP